ncbi:MAG: DUF4328 domain-containing protein [Aureispira sp.]|nr:DUF4328 domain-containing protein [Aureispira sp.]
MSLEILDNEYIESGEGKPHGIKDNEQRGKIAVGAMVAFCVVAVIGVISDIMQYDFVHDFSIGNADFADGQANDQRQMLVGVLSLIAYLINAVVFIMWLRRAYFNLHIHSPESARFSEGWAAGAWFVPFLNFVRPVQIVNDLWDGIQNKLNTRFVETKGLVAAWWTVWIIMSITSQVSFRSMNSATSLNDIFMACYLSFVHDAVMLLGAILAIVVINKIRGFEARLEQEWS